MWKDDMNNFPGNKNFQRIALDRFEWERLYLDLEYAALIILKFFFIHF